MLQRFYTLLKDRLGLDDIYFVGLDTLLTHLKNRLTTMSNQNFDTNDAFSSSQQPIPIAKQLEAQAYLSQVQNQRRNAASKEEDSSMAQLSGRFAAPSAPAEEIPQPRNNMDSFFQRAEEEERQRVLEAQNPTEQTPEQSAEESSLEPAADLQPSEPVQQYETPVVELPQVDMTGEAFATPPEMAAPTEEAQEVQEEQQENAEFKPAPQTFSSFSSDSLSTDLQDQNPTSDSPSQFSTQQYVTNEPISAIPPVVEDQLTSQQTPTPQPQMETFDSPENHEPAEATDNPEARRLTGAAGLSAGMALAGIGGLGALKASASAQSEQPIESQSSAQPPETDNPVDSLVQQLANERQQAASGEDTANRSVDARSGDAVSESNDANQPDRTPFESSPANAYGRGNAQPPLTRQNVFAENVSSSPHEIPPAVTSGFSGGFNPVGQTPATPASENLGEDAGRDFAPPSNEEPSNEEPSNTPSAATQVEAEQAQPPQSSATTQDGDVKLVDMRLAAEQQAQRIKAERAKALVDGPDVAARPYGADRQCDKRCRPSTFGA